MILKKMSVMVGILLSLVVAIPLTLFLLVAVCAFYVSTCVFGESPYADRKTTVAVPLVTVSSFFLWKWIVQGVQWFRRTQVRVGKSQNLAGK
jgi:hypothetical protein